MRCSSWAPVLKGGAELALRFAPGGGECAFDGGLEQGLAVLLQLLLRGLQLRHAGIEVGQQFFEFGDDAGLFSDWRQGDFNAVQVITTQPRYRRGSIKARKVK